MEKLLLHICCGPCSAPIIPNLISKFDVLGFYFNPNIYPDTEFENRMASAVRSAEFNGVRLAVPNQQREDFFEYIGETKSKPDRCLLCYKQRLTKTAEYARENGCSHFSTTLLISPFQYHDDLNAIGEAAGKEFGVKFYYQDFRPLYKESRDLSKELDLYIQKYCGCKFSRKRK